MADDWTELVSPDEGIDDPEEARRLLRVRLAARGLDLDDLDPAADIRLRRYHVRRPGESAVRHPYGVLVRQERLRDAL